MARRGAIHEAAARRLQRGSYWLAVPTTMLAAVAGTSAFAAGQEVSASDAPMVTEAAKLVGPLR